MLKYQLSFFTSTLEMTISFWLRIFAFALSILFFSKNLVRSSAQSSGDELALMSLKSLVTYDPYGTLASWGNSSLHFCNWFGVTCSNHNGVEPRVTALELRSIGLAGSISPSLGNLTFLQKLHISETQLSGSIPHEVGSLSELQYLNLSFNLLSGEIPCTLSHCSLLQNVSLRNNMLYGGIPPEIGKLVNLQVLSLGYNLLGGTIPLSIGELPMLEWFSLSSNQFFGAIPSSFCNLSYLSALYMYENQLEGGIPPCLGNLTSLNSLALNDNNLTGHIPHSLGIHLEQIDLSFNNLCGNIPPSLGNLRFLVFLNMGFNNLSGVIPDSIWNLTFLEVLYLTNNSLIGTLPMKSLPSLAHFHLGSNNLHGPIPVSLFNFSALEMLELYTNFFYGPIHSSIGNLKNLSIVDLSDNFLQATNIKEWSFISALTNCTKLQELDLFINNLEGTLPHSIVNLTETLNILRLQGNNISGNIPIEIENLIGLIWLSLGENNLTGTIPVGIGKLNSLGRLELHENSFVGEIPDSLGNLSILTRLSLNGNSFSGYIPSSLGRCKQLTSLYIDNNKLIGSIPSEILSISSLSLGINLANNLLVGPLPIDIGFLVNLVFLRVSNNKLTGQIPSNLGACVQLRYLYMDNNLFHGNISSSLGALKSLEQFDLSHNNLTGTIPEFLESLQQLDLSYNHLEGEVPKIGIFLNTSAFSVYENDKLCGGIAELKLPPCLVSKFVSRKKHNSMVVLATIIPITCIFLFSIVVSFLLLKCRNKKSKKLSMLEKDENFVRVSYDELRRATNEFSACNLIGRGSFGFVYLGNMDQNWRKSIAVKVLNLQQRGASKSFEAECKALKNVRHRNLVRILTSCSSIDHEGNDFKALVFEYMSNGNLDKWLHQQSIYANNIRNNLTMIQRMNIIIDVASALDYLHNDGPIPIVHCDLKPSNVLLDEDMVAHLSDFGLARLLVEIATQTSMGSNVLKGTIGYAAPEYGAANQASVEGDVYSYGIILLEMFTGRRPTDEIFNEDLNLHVFVKAALPKRAMDIVDPFLLLQEEEDDEAAEGLLRIKSIKKFELECIVWVLNIGLLCSEESPAKRMQISQALNELNAIRNILVKAMNEDTATHL